MTSKRVKIRPLTGGVDNDNREKLSDLLFQRLKLKYSRIMEAGDCFAVVCLNEENVDHLISANSINTLKQFGFDIILPPHLRARKCVIIRGMDKSVHKWTEDQFKLDLESRNEWAKVDSVFKMRNIPHMLKVRFEEIAMARKACNDGLALHTTHLGKTQIEMEEFIPLTPCWNCYKYDHVTNDCPLKSTQFCSECATIGHTYKQCTNQNSPKCLNCDGAHRTLAAICPIRKELLKQKREEKKKNQKTFETQNKTYCAVAKMQADLPKEIQTQIQNQAPQQTVLHISDKLSLKVLVMIVEAHLFNMGNPGSFNNRLNQLLHLNNFPTIKLPNDAPSNEIFNIINQSPIYATDGEEQEDIMSTESESESEDENDNDEDNENDTEQQTQQVVQPAQSTKTSTHTKETSQTHKQQQQSQQQQQAVRPKEQRTPQKQQQRRAPAPPPSPVKETRRKQPQQPGQDIGLLFFTYEKSGVLDSMAPEQLYRCIREGKVKFTYEHDQLSESDILRYIREGTLSTLSNKIKTTEASVFKKIRNGLHKRSPGDITQKQKRFSSQ